MPTSSTSSSTSANQHCFAGGGGGNGDGGRAEPARFGYVRSIRSRATAPLPAPLMPRRPLPLTPPPPRRIVPSTLAGSAAASKPPTTSDAAADRRPSLGGKVATGRCKNLRCHGRGSATEEGGACTGEAATARGGGRGSATPHNAGDLQVEYEPSRPPLLSTVVQELLGNRRSWGHGLTVPIGPPGIINLVILGQVCTRGPFMARGTAGGTIYEKFRSWGDRGRKLKYGVD